MTAEGEDEPDDDDMVGHKLPKPVCPYSYKAYREAATVGGGETEEDEENPIKPVEWSELGDVIKKHNAEINPPEVVDLTDDNGLSPWVQARHLLTEEEFSTMIKERDNGLFLWRTSLGDHHQQRACPLNINLLDMKDNRVKEEERKIAEHDKDRNQFLRHGLHQLLYIKKVFQLDTTEMMELIWREDQRMNNFPDHTRTEIYDVMVDKRRCLCKMAKLENKAKSNAVADLAAELVSAIDAAELGLQVRPDQPGTASGQAESTKRVGKIEKRVSALERYTGLKGKLKKNDAKRGRTAGVGPSDIDTDLDSPSGGGRVDHVDTDPHSDRKLERDLENPADQDAGGPVGPGEGANGGGN